MRKGFVLLLMVVLSTSSLVYGGTYEADVKTHRSQGPVKVVEGATAQLISTEAGIAGSFTTKDLTPGHVCTLWVAIMNNPEACEKAPENCTSQDVLKRTEAVNSDVTYGDGVVVAADGTATFRTFIPAGMIENSWLGNGLPNPTGAEIHFAIHDHGPVIPDKIQDMLSTTREGCTDESLPKLWPDTARASGKPGPNECRMVQFAIFQQN